MPNHVIRDRIWASKKLARCSRDAALAYPWIFLIADDHGRFEYHPRRIWGLVFSSREDISAEDVAGWLGEYEREGLLRRYHVDLAVWAGFEGRPPTRRRASLYPDPDAAPVLEHTATKPEQSGTKPLPLAEQSRAEQETEQSGAGNGNGALPESAVYVREVEAAFLEASGRPATKGLNSVECSLALKWYALGIPLRTVATAMAETRNKAEARSLTYFGPSVEEAAKRLARAVPL